VVEPTLPPLVDGQALQRALNVGQARQNDLTAAALALVGRLPAEASHVLHARDVQVHGLAVKVGAVRPELVAAAPAVAAAQAARPRRLPAELEDAAVLEDAVRQARAARVEVQVVLEAVVHETARGLAAGVADRAVDGGRGLREEHELAGAEQRVLQSGVLLREGAWRVKVEAGALAATAGVPRPVARLLAAVADERRAGVRHQLENVSPVRGVGDLLRRILVLPHDELSLGFLLVSCYT